MVDKQVDRALTKEEMKRDIEEAEKAIKYHQEQLSLHSQQLNATVGIRAYLLDKVSKIEAAKEPKDKGDDG